MPLNLGLVCKLHPDTVKAIDAKNNIGIKYKKDWNKISISGKIGKSHKDFLSLNAQEQYKLSKARTIKNIEYTKYVILEAVKLNIQCVRISSELIAKPDYWDWHTDSDILRLLSELRQYNKVFTIHPDQFTVLCSQRQEVIDNSISILEYHKTLCDILGIEHIIIHLGATKPTKEDAMIKFAEVFSKLSPELQSLIRLENDHYYDFNDVLTVNSLCGVDTCYDAHHERVIHKDYVATFEDVINIKKMLEVNKYQSICHLSSGKAHKYDKAHNDYIVDIEYKDIVNALPSVIFEIEAKAKDLATRKFKEEL